VWEKLTNYMEIEPRWVANRPGAYTAATEDLIAACDENTIGGWGSLFVSCLDLKLPARACIAPKDSLGPET
jgi:glutamate/tyrosine decarboxylase-like PLP-dependent enzyme